MTAVTDPWAPDVAALPTTQFRVVASATLTPAGTTSALPVTLTRAVIDYDERRTPYARATLTCTWPPALTRAQLDPRRGLTVTIIAGYQRLPGSATDLAVMATLRVESVTADYVGRSLDIVALSDEADVVANPSTSSTSYAAGSGVVAAIQDQVAACFPGETLAWDLHSLTGSGRTFGASQVVDIGDDRWDAVTDWADSIGAKVYHDGLGTWHVRKLRSGPSATTSAALRGGPGGALTGLLVTDTREGWANQAVVAYAPKATAGPPTVLSGTATTGMTPPRTAVVTRRRKPEALGLSARTALTRALRRGHQATATATAYLWVRPRSTVTIQLPGAHQERLLVQASSFDLIGGSMTLIGQDDADNLTATMTSTEQVSAAGVQSTVVAGVGGAVWVPPGNAAAGVLSIGATQGFFSAVYLPTDRTVTAVGVQVTTAGTRTICIGIWAMARDGTPGALVFDSGALASVLGVVSATGLTLTLPAGWYYFGIGHRAAAGTTTSVRTRSSPQVAVFPSSDTRGWQQSASEFQSALISNPTALVEQSFTDTPSFRLVSTET